MEANLDFPDAKAKERFCNNAIGRDRVKLVEVCFRATFFTDNKEAEIIFAGSVGSVTSLLFYVKTCR